MPISLDRALVSKQAGSALLTVLWLTAALSAIGLAVANNVRGETERAATNVDDARSYFIARGAIERAALHFLWGVPVYTRGVPAMDLDFPGGVAHVEIIPETSKLNLNCTRPEEIEQLLVALGTPESRALDITAAIVDWRTPDPLHASPIDSFYLIQQPSFFARHASFTENEELLLVKGMTSDLYYGSSLDREHAGLRDCVSVYGSTGAIDVATAQAATMQAVGLTAADAAGILKLRAQRPIGYTELAEIVQVVGPAGARLGIGGQTIFTLRATARMKQPDGKLSDLRRTAAALVKFTLPGNPRGRPPGFEVLRWFDRA
jgi:general secretion pathway protein K